MSPHDRALELPALAREDEQAASVLEIAGMGDGPDGSVGFHYLQAVEKLLKVLARCSRCGLPQDT